MEKEKLKEIITKLTEYGEDAEEMQYWLDIYDDLPEEQQKETFENFSEELKKLKDLK